MKYMVPGDWRQFQSPKPRLEQDGGNDVGMPTVSEKNSCKGQASLPHLARRSVQLEPGHGNEDDIGGDQAASGNYCDYAFIVSTRPLLADASEIRGRTPAACW